MASYSTSWTLPSSFMPSSNGSAAMKPATSAVDNPHNENGVSENCTPDDGILHVTIHQAKHIHNICIYGNQDVYAKFLFTHCQDAVYPTQPVRAGGRNPVFNQSLEIPICGRRDAILKCELWMMSCARNYLQDQLLGFVLVPLNTVYGKGKQTGEYCLTSTDLFYTPAGTVHLSLAIFDHNSIEEVGSNMVPECTGSSYCPPSSLDFQEVMMDCGQQSAAAAAHLCKVEFLDLEAASEDQHLVSMYYKLAAAGATFEESDDSGSSLSHSGHAGSEIAHAGHGDVCENDQNAQGDYVSSLEMKDTSMAAPSMAAVVHVHASSVSSVDDEMLSSPREGECVHVPSYFSGIAPPSAVSETAVLGVEVAEPISNTHPLRKQPPASLYAVECTRSPPPPPAMQETQEKEEISATPQPNMKPQANQAAVPYGAALVNVAVEPETTINQEHFVDLYLKSMQQFTDKLADMKFSFDIDANDIAALRSVQVDKATEGRRKQGSKLYYGSRAFY